MGMPFAHLLLPAPILNMNWLVGFHHICDLELGIHLLEEEPENAHYIMQEEFCMCECAKEGICNKWSFNWIL